MKRAKERPAPRGKRPARARATLRLTERALRESEQQYRLLLETMAEGVVLQLADGAIAACNAAAERILGLSADQMAGRTSLDPRWRAIHEDGSPFPGESHPAMVAVRTGAGQSDVRMGVHRPDGSLIWISINSLPLVHEGETRPYAAVTSFHDITARKRAEQQLSDEQQRLALLTENVPAMIAYLDAGCRFRYANLRYRLFYGGSEAPITGRRMDEVLTPQTWQTVRARVEQGLAGEAVAYEGARQLHDGSRRYVAVSLVPHRGEDGAVLGLYVLALDITVQHDALQRLRRLGRLHAMLSGINAAIVRVRDRGELFEDACRLAVQAGGFRMAWVGVVDRAAGVVRPAAWAGEGARAFLDAAPLAILETAPAGHGLAGRAVREMRPVISNDIEADPQRLMKKECAELGVRSLAVMPLAVGGEAAGVLALYAAEAGFFDEEEARLAEELAGDVAFALDHLAKEEKVHYLAYYDSLTGLANRSLLLERLAQHVAAARERGESLALVIVNLERFKIINDTLGRQVGDELLRRVAQRLQLANPDETRIARVGADEFAVVMTHLGTQDELAQRLRRGAARLTGEPFDIAGRQLRVSFRSGVALFPADGADAESLFRNAEAALRKARSGEDFVFYAQQMTERIAGKLELENRLRLAVERREFVLHYQPKVELATRRIAGAEALLRWRSPELGLVPPGEFIPMLEETGLIGQVGAWALARAVDDQRGWRGRGRAAPRISVNVSALELHRPDFVANVKEVLGRGAAPAIDLEITESVLMEDIERSVQKLQALRGLGVRVAIDDFGTGYSSLGYLARLPVQALKIDRAFILAMLDEPDIMALVSTILSLGRALRLEVIAEGVETEAQAKALSVLRCDEAQGYLFGKPLPADEFESLLRA